MPGENGLGAGRKHLNMSFDVVGIFTDEVCHAAVIHEFGGNHMAVSANQRGLTALVAPSRFHEASAWPM